MIRRSLALLLSAYLLAWIPLGFAIELFSSASSLDMRGGPAVIELTVHGIVGVLCATAGYTCVIRSPSAAPLAAAAVIAAGGIAIQSLYWTALPRQVAPGERPALVVAACVTAVFWLSVVAVAVRQKGSSTPQ
jgi:hypothetical protein